MSNQQSMKTEQCTAQNPFSLVVDNDLMAIRAKVENVAKSITPVWPLETFIACNPLHGFESKSFEEAIVCSQALLEQSQDNESLKAVNLEMIKWCGAFLDVGQGTIDMPHRDKGFYYGFTKMAAYDKQLHLHNKANKNWLHALPENPELAIKLALDKLKIKESNYDTFIKETLYYLPGWAGYVKWLSEWKGTSDNHSKPVDLINFLAVRLIITCLLWPEAGHEKKK